MGSIEHYARKLGPMGTIAVVVLTAVIVNLIIYAVGAMAGADYDFTNNGEAFSVHPVTLVMFTAMPLLIGLAIVAFLAPRWRWVIPAALIIAPLAAIGTIFSMTLPVDLSTASTIALAMAHVALAIIAVMGVLAMRACAPR